MGWVPPGPLARAPGMTDAEYRRHLDLYGVWLDRRITRYRSSVGPWMLAAALLLPVLVVLAILTLVGL